MLQPFRLLWRLLVIARTLARHDALSALSDLGVAPLVSRLVSILPRRKVEGRPGQKLANALTELGPIFIKLGQFLSTRADLLGDQVAADLSELQDSLPPFPAQEARATIERELGRPISLLFESFEDRPISAASIAQVHLAVTPPPADQAEAPEGGDEILMPADAPAPREVAVKVLRPGIEEAFERDLAFLFALADLTERSQPSLRRFRPREVVETFARTVRIEMDLRMEAAAASELAANFEGDESYHVPQVDWQRSGRRVLTQERVSGIPLDDREGLIAAGHDLPAVLGKAAEIFFNQVFRDGFFHGDQHPGNMWVDAEGNIVAVDFGIMGRLDRRTRCYLADMLRATLERDYRALAAVHREAGYLPPGGDIETFAQALRSVCEPIFGRPLAEISFARLLAQVFQVTETFAMPVQPQLLLLQKNMLMAEGVSRRLDSELNIWTLAQPLIEDWMRANRGPEARIRDAARDIVETIGRAPETLRALERAAGRVATAEPPPAAANGAGLPLSPMTVLPWALVGLLLLLLLLS